MRASVGRGLCGTGAAMGHLWLWGTWGLWGLLQCVAYPRTDGSKIIPRVTEIIPKYGSINGATRLTIKGEGFAQANQFSYGVDNAELGNSVQLVSSFRSVSCDVEKDSSHSTQITCYTRAMPEDSYTVRVSVDGVPITENNTCKGHIKSWACIFNAKSFRTPTIRSITPLSGTPGTLITIQGRIFTDVYGSNTALSSNGKNVRILRVYTGGMPCELLIPQSDDLYGLKLDHLNGDMGSMVCKTTGTYIGHHNVSFILDSDYGRSLPQKIAYFVSSLNKISMFQTYAEVTTISPSRGSIQGGTMLTISGRFFDQTDFPVRVLVGGQDCDILNVTENSICCKTPPKPDILRTVYPGGRGLKLEIWNNSRPVHLEEILEYNEKTPGYMGASWVDSASYVWPMEQDTFVARFSGFLVVTDSDVYRFYIKGDDRYAIYFSQTGLPEDKVRIAYHSSNANSYFSSPTQRSDDIHLQKGNECSPVTLSLSLEIKSPSGLSACCQIPVTQIMAVSWHEEACQDVLENLGLDEENIHKYRLWRALCQDPRNTVKSLLCAHFKGSIRDVASPLVSLVSASSPSISSCSPCVPSRGVRLQKWVSGDKN